MALAHLRADSKSAASAASTAFTKPAALKDDALTRFMMNQSRSMPALPHEPRMLPVSPSLAPVKPSPVLAHVREDIVPRVQQGTGLMGSQGKRRRLFADVFADGRSGKDDTAALGPDRAPIMGREYLAFVGERPRSHKLYPHLCAHLEKMEAGAA